jgi:hypothetical protein
LRDEACGLSQYAQDLQVDHDFSCRPNSYLGDRNVANDDGKNVG